MNVTKDAASLREIASRLESVAASIPRSAQDLIRRFAPLKLCVTNYVEMCFLGSSTYDARKHLCRQAAHQISEHIAEKLEYEWVNGGSGMQHRADLSDSRYTRQAYTASVIVLAPAELQRLVEEAYRAGRCA